MTPRAEPVEHVPALHGGLLKYPSHRDEGTSSTGDSYLAGRRMDDGAEGLWRIHDNLYDLSSFAKRHPGGEYWIRLTEGTDITEAFEAHHVSSIPEKMLPKFLVREAKEPRNSPFTFKEDGFYRTLKRRAAEVLDKTPTPRYSSAFNDSLAAISFALAVSAAALRSFALATLAGAAITLVATCAHNFMHLKANWRQYYISLSLLSLSEFRVTHILSHHLYTNTLQDMEISMHEPILQFLPSRSKGLLSRFGSWFVFPLYGASAFLVQAARRLLFDTRRHAEDLLPLLYPAAMWALTDAPLGTVLLLFLYMSVVSSSVFHFIAFTVAHHHPDIYHAGDAPRVERDWGLGQLDAVRDRADHGSNRFLLLTQFGDHALHHLFPTVDHCRLSALYPVVYETLKEFGVEYRFTNTWVLLKGCFLQLARSKPNPTPPSAVIGCEKHLRS